MLARYLHATSVLEICIVNRVAAELAHGPARWNVTPSARLDALKLLCDEAYHAVLASDLLRQLGGVEENHAPAFVARLDALLPRDEAEQAIVRFLFCVVTETCISASLIKLARDPHIRPGLRAFVIEHARDESRHAAFFGALFKEFWIQLTPKEQQEHSRLLPKLIDAFLQPALPSITADLVSVGVQPQAAERLVATLYTPERISAQVAAAARPVYTCFRRAGAEMK